MLVAVEDENLQEEEKQKLARKQAKSLEMKAVLLQCLTSSTVPSELRVVSRICLHPDSGEQSVLRATPFGETMNVVRPLSVSVLSKLIDSKHVGTSQALVTTREILCFKSNVETPNLLSDVYTLLINYPKAHRCSPCELLRLLSRYKSTRSSGALNTETESRPLSL